MVEVAGVEPASAIRPKLSHSQAYLIYYHKSAKIGGYNLCAYRPVALDGLIFTSYLLFCSNWIEGFEQPPDYAARATSKWLLLFATIVFELLRPYLTYLHSALSIPRRNLYHPRTFLTMTPTGS
jgi:hypothetical protein